MIDAAAPATDRSDRSGPVYDLMGPDGQAVASRRPGELGGHKRSKIYGRLDCPAALRALAHGHFVTYRVFFADEDAAVAAGYRPCAVCFRGRYDEWKQAREAKP